MAGEALCRGSSRLVPPMRNRSAGAAYDEHGQAYVPSPFAFKIETALQLVPGLTVQVVDAGSVTTWVNHGEPVLPAFAEGTGNATEANRRTRAVGMAVFAIAHANNSKYFPEGWNA